MNIASPWFRGLTPTVALVAMVVVVVFLVVEHVYEWPFPLRRNESR